MAEPNNKKKTPIVPFLNCGKASILILAILGCVAGVISRNAFVYILGFMTLVATILFGLLVVAVNFIWKLLPGDLKKTYQGKIVRFNTIFFSFALFCYIVAGLIDEIYLRSTPGFIRLLGLTTIIVFAAFLWWSSIRRSRAKTVIAGSVLFFLCIILLLFFNSITLKSSEIIRDSDIGKLGSLPYLEWVSAKKDIEKSGVVQYDPKLALDGLNLYSSWTSPEAYLIDMNGNIAHKWTQQIEGCDVWKDHVELCRNKDLMVLAVDKMLICLDWDSKVKWKRKMRVHHDIFVDEDKAIYVLAREDGIVFWQGMPVPIVHEYIAVLSPDGNLKEKIYLYDFIRDRVKLPRIVKLYRGIFRFREIVKFFVHKIQVNWVCQQSLHFDIMHTNSIEVMDKNIEGFCKKGDLLISMRNLNLVAVLDINKKEFVWTWGPGEVSMQHDAQLLENGNVLIFDNGYGKGFSRIVEMNPLTKKIVWEYKSDSPEEFFSRLSGSNQRLSNGNTLIAESTKGHAFEITKDGKIVWDYYNPNIRKKDKKRETIYRIRRITDPEIKKLIKKQI